jgi:RNA polymerase sigma-70 factor (ECF subfamily)
MDHDAGLAPQTLTGTTIELLFREHFKGLHAYACTIIKEEETAEDIVQNVFFRLWEKKEALPQVSSVAAYLYRSVHNESLNCLKHAKVKQAYQQFAMHHHKEEIQPSGKSSLHELEHRLEGALNELPEACRTIFQLSRFEELKYREIAERLGLSVKTVENQMGKALRLMREKLVDYLPAALLLLLLRF